MCVLASIRSQLAPVHREGLPYIGAFALASLFDEVVRPRSFIEQRVARAREPQEVRGKAPVERVEGLRAAVGPGGVCAVRQLDLEVRVHVPESLFHAGSV